MVATKEAKTCKVTRSSEVHLKRNVRMNGRRELEPAREDGWMIWKSHQNVMRNRVDFSPSH